MMIIRPQYHRRHGRSVPESIYYNLRDTVNGHFIGRNIKTIYPNDIACRWSSEWIVWPIDRWINKRHLLSSAAHLSIAWWWWSPPLMLMNRWMTRSGHKLSGNSLEWLLIQTFVCHTRWTRVAETNYGAIKLSSHVTGRSSYIAWH